MKKEDGDRQFYHYASTLDPATVIFTKSQPEIELGLKQHKHGETLKFMKETKTSCYARIL